MSVRFPDILQHENSNYAIVDINDIRGIYIIDSLDNIGDIPSDKRRLGAVLSVIGDTIYSYAGIDLNDDSWSQPSSWHSVGGGDVSNAVTIYSTLDEVEALTQKDNKSCVYCVETQQIYKYFKDGSSFIDNPPYVVPAGDEDGGSKYVSLFFMNANTSYIEGEGISIDLNNNMISADFNVVAKKEDTDKLYEELEITNEILNETAELLNETVEEVENIEDLIPGQATPENKLADKDFVNSSIEKMAARYITYDADGNPFPTKESLFTAETYYYNGHTVELTTNDYTLVFEDEDHPMYESPETYPSARYLWTSEGSPEIGQWNFQYIVNNTPFTSDQYKAINSGITEPLVTKLKNVENCQGDGSSTKVENHVISILTDLPVNESLVITPTWTINGTGQSNVASLSVEEGSSVTLSAKYKWTHDDTHKDPQTTRGMFDVLTESGVESDEFAPESAITTSTEYSQTIEARKQGLEVNDYGKVVYSDGYDSFTKSISVTFKNYRYYGGSSSDSLGSDGVKSLPNKVLATKSNINNEVIQSVTVDNNTYFYYAYPSAFGELKYIYQNNVLDVLTAFTKSTVTVTNFQGVNKSYYVYRSKKGAFTDKSLKFVF